jgi:hypothetical protein
LKANQQEPARHHYRVGDESMAQKAAPRPPPTQRDENRGQRENLSDLDADVEAHDIRDQAIRRQLELLQFRG